VQSSVATQVRAFVVSNYLFGQDGRLPADHDSLIESGVVDSTGILELIEFLEETFGISVDDTETVPDNLGSVAGITAFVGSKLADGGLAPSLSA
jgi:acyl carrier protein